MNTKINFLIYLFFGAGLTAVIMLCFTWWLDYANYRTMFELGYDFDALNDVERFRNVFAENREALKIHEHYYFGIGWPLRAFFYYTVYAPYVLLIFIVRRWIFG